MPVSAIIPAYNEENTIEGVINIIKKNEHIDEIIVVSDGSGDKTAEVSRRCGATVIELPENMGKGAAVKKGLEACSGDIVLLLDADLIGLKSAHLDRLIEPVAKGTCDMCVGVFRKGRLSTDIAHKITPFLSGQRVVRKNIFNGLADLEDAGFGTEVAITQYARKRNIKVVKVVLEDLTHVIKEEKFGLARGFARRIMMYWQIYRKLMLARR